jgi:hypothetical protein
LIWDSLNATWSNYGTTPININYAHADLCGGPVTYDKLVASEADVVIISDPAGGLEQYSADEVSALRQYAQDGHALIGTFMLLQWRDFDNRGLAPLFGLASGVAFNPTERVLQNTNSR